MTNMGSLVQVNIGVAAVSIAYCLNEARKVQLFSSVISPASLLNQPANLRIALAAAGSSSIFLGLSLLERAFFREDSTGALNHAFYSDLEKKFEFAAKFSKILQNPKSDSPCRLSTSHLSSPLITSE